MLPARHDDDDDDFLYMVFPYVIVIMILYKITKAMVYSSDG